MTALADARFLHRARERLFWAQDLALMTYSLLATTQRIGLGPGRCPIAPGTP